MAFSLLAVAFFGGMSSWIGWAVLVLCGVFVWATVQDVPDISLREDWREFLRWRACGRFCDLLVSGGVVSEDTAAGDVLVRCLSAGELNCFEVRLKQFLIGGERIKSLCESSLMAFDAAEVSVEQVDNRTLRITFSSAPVYDALADMDVRLRDVPRPDGIRSIPVGKQVDGSPVCLCLESANGMIAGVPGSGKSVMLSVLLCQLSRIPNESVFICSPKSLDFMAFADCMSVLERPEDMLELMRELGEEEQRRKAYLQANRMKKFSEFDATYPHITVVVDEFSVLKGAVVTSVDDKGKQGKPRKIGVELETAIKHLVERGRYVGISFVLATQRVSSGNIDTDLRDLISGFRISFGLETVESTRMIFADRAADAPAHEIPHSARGVGYLLQDGTATAFKGAFADDSAERQAAESAVCKRIDLME